MKDWASFVSQLDQQIEALNDLSQALEEQRSAVAARDLTAMETSTAAVQTAIARVSGEAAATLLKASGLAGRPIERLAQVRELPDVPRHVFERLLEVRGAAERSHRDLRINSRVVRRLWSHQNDLLCAAAGIDPDQATYERDPVRRQSSKKASSGARIDGNA